jgi:transposase
MDDETFKAVKAIKRRFALVGIELTDEQARVMIESGGGYKMNLIRAVEAMEMQNDALESEIEVRLAAVREAARRVELMKKAARVKAEAVELDRQIREIENGKPKLVCRKGYWELLG